MCFHAQILAYLFLFLSSAIPPAFSICYYPDGTATNEDQPCLSGTEVSWCCGFGYACLDNKLCMATVETPNATEYVRGSCTDNTWRDANCPNFCVNGDGSANDLLSGGEGVAKCENSDRQLYYCIDFNTAAVDCAKTSNIALQATGTASILTTIGFGGSTPSTTSTSTSLSSTSHSRSPTPSSEVIVSQHKTSSGHISTTRIVASSFISSSTASASAATASAPSSATIIGASVGASLGAISLALVATFLLFRRHQRKRGQSEFPPENVMQRYTEQRPPEYNDQKPYHLVPVGSGIRNGGGDDGSVMSQMQEMEAERGVHELWAGTPRLRDSRN